MHSYTTLVIVIFVSLTIGYFANDLGRAYNILPGYENHSAKMSTTNNRVGTSLADDEAMNHRMNMDPEPVAALDRLPIPSVQIVEAKRDMMGAYSVKIETSNFTFTPDRVDDEPIPNQGHAHIYVNNEKVGREYSEWMYVPASFFSETGPNRITVTLNANTHGEWTYLNNPIQDTRVVN